MRLNLLRECLMARRAANNPGEAAWMSRAVELARKGEGLTRPNPPVGAVVVREGNVVGEGWHRKAGGPHAEVFALRAAGELARGADLYVTLEPCSSTGRTPPCTQAIMAAGIQRVFAGARDPDPRHVGRGMKILSQAGITASWCASMEAEALVAPFAMRVKHGRPWVTLKTACSLDGRIADFATTSRWISGPSSRKKVAALRTRVDGILVGTRTVIADDPSLLPRPARGRAPWRIVLDHVGKLPASARVFQQGENVRSEGTVCFMGKECSSMMVSRRRKLGIHCELVGMSPAGGCDLEAVLKRCAEYGMMHVLCEGGGQLAGSLIRAGLVDEWWHFTAPIVLGDKGTPLVAGISWPLADAPKWRIIHNKSVGADTLHVLRPTRLSRARNKE